MSHENKPEERTSVEQVQQELPEEQLEHAAGAGNSCGSAEIDFVEVGGGGVEKTAEIDFVEVAETPVSKEGTDERRRR